MKCDRCGRSPVVGIRTRERRLRLWRLVWTWEWQSERFCLTCLWESDCPTEVVRELQEKLRRQSDAGER